MSSSTLDPSLLLLIPAVLIGFVALYWIIRFAVKGAIRDADKLRADAVSAGGPVGDAEDAGDGSEER